MPPRKHPVKQYGPAIGITAAVVLIVAATVMFSRPKQTTAPSPNTNSDLSVVTLTTTDGVKLAATHKAPVRNSLSPVVVLLHQYAQDRHQWDPYLQDFLDAGIVVLSYDMRGFGASPLKVIPKSMEEHLDSLPLDFPTIMNYLHGDPSIDQDKISFIGASVGADAAFVASGSHLNIHRTVLLSPVKRGTALDGHLVTDFAPTDIFGIASDAEQSDLEFFMAKAGDPKKTKIVPNGGHGIELLKQPEVMSSMIAWITS